MWCVMKSPLLIGTDVTNMTAATLATLTNTDAIAVNQDSLGVQATLVTAVDHAGADADNADYADYADVHADVHAAAQQSTERPAAPIKPARAGGVGLPGGFAGAGSAVIAAPCVDSDADQLWDFTSDGRVRPRVHRQGG